MSFCGLDACMTRPDDSDVQNRAADGEMEDGGWLETALSTVWPAPNELGRDGEMMRMSEGLERRGKGIVE